MKRNKIILTILILSIIALIFSGCDGGGSVTPPSSTPVVELVKPLDDYENNISQRFGNYLGYYGGALLCGIAPGCKKGAGEIRRADTAGRGRHQYPGKDIKKNQKLNRACLKFKIDFS